MEITFGTLRRNGLSTYLEAGEYWLLMTGFPDPKQAGVAATNFIFNVKHLSENTPVAVTGTKNTIGTQPVIVMSDINAAGSLMEHAMASPDFNASGTGNKQVKNSSPKSKAKTTSSAMSRSNRSTGSKAEK
jgi:hypothetical protein